MLPQGFEFDFNCFPVTPISNTIPKTGSGPDPPSLFP